MILLLGGSGHVGTEYRKQLEARGAAYSAPTRAQIDYTRAEKLRALIRELRPRFLINAAGYTGKPNVDACELHKADCLDGNAVFPARIREVCEEARLPWAHVSSGCIYSGTRADGSGLTEEDAPNFSFRSPPCSFYAGTKALGEELLAGADCYIWRLRLPLMSEDHPRNYLTKIMRYARLHDAVNSLSRLDHFVTATLALWEKQAAFGIYNVTHPGAISTREVTELLQSTGICPRAFDFFRDEAEFLSLAAKTPRSNCVLDSSKIARTGVPLLPIQEALADALKNWRWESDASRRLALRHSEPQPVAAASTSLSSRACRGT